MLDLRPDPLESAREAGLRYVHDATPGIRRERRGGRYRYRAPDGARITDRAEIARINQLAIPPAWTDVWICPNPRGHIQATGRDARGRKQYRYHPRWAATRGEAKYERMAAFGAQLPEIRARVAHDLDLPGLPRAKTLATVVALLDRTLARIGNQTYAHANAAYGLTTMRQKHVEISGTSVRFEFRGKGGKERTIEVQNRRLAIIVRRYLDLPGYELFQYLDPDGQRHTITSDDVNAYLREITGQDFTAKDFRTWGAGVVALDALRTLSGFTSDAEAHTHVTEAIALAARALGNTPAICRKSYVNPAIVTSYLDGTLISILDDLTRDPPPPDLAALRPEEVATLLYLRHIERPPATAVIAS